MSSFRLVIVVIFLLLSLVNSENRLISGKRLYCTTHVVRPPGETVCCCCHSCSNHQYLVALYHRTIRTVAHERKGRQEERPPENPSRTRSFFFLFSLSRFLLYNTKR